MKLIARLFALSLVVTGAVASTQIHASSNKVVNVGAGMSMIPPAGCDPSGGCGMSGK